MRKLEFETGYQKDASLRASFCKLANQIFGLDFEKWYDKGFWQERYIPFSFIDEGEVIANVSVNKIDLVIGGKTHSALQIGTVMTHPDYRNQGLSRKLMEKVLDEFEGQYEFMYLFANDTVMDFYPKFGFQQVEERQFSAASFSTGTAKEKVKKLDIADASDFQVITGFVEGRVPVSNRFATANAKGITMYHCLNVFSNHLYYLKSQDVLAIFQKEGQQVELFDIISKGPVSIRSVVEAIADAETETILFYFTPDDEELQIESKLFKRSGALFVRENSSCSYPREIMHPVTSEA
jgi:predicted N-acetyltransferase YhbS